MTEIKKLVDLKLSEEQKTRLGSVLNSKVWVACSDCGKVFYRSTAGVFMSSFNVDKPSQQYLDGARHWVETDHKIMFMAHGIVQCLSVFWDIQRVQLGLTKQNFLNAIIKMESEK